MEVDDVAVAVGEDLHLDVAGAVHESLDEHRPVAERGRRLAAAALERLGDVAGAVHGAHAPAASAGGGLEHDRVAELAGRLGRGLRVGDRASRAGHDGDAERLGELAGPHLVAEQGERVRRRADEREPGSRGLAGEVGVLGQEAVPGVDAVGSARRGDLDDRRPVEVGGDGIGRPADQVRLRGDACVQRPLVDGGVHGDGFDAERIGGAGDADGDLAAVGDEDAVEGS